MSNSMEVFKKPKPVTRKVNDPCHEEDERVRMGSGLYFNPHAASATFRCLSASPFSKSDKDSETSGSQVDDEDCGLVMSFTPSSPVCVPWYRYHNFQGNCSPVALRSLPRFLPPIGVFWDIENCQVPKGRSAMAVAQAIRDRFFTGYREAEFLVVCDVKKENSQVIQELNDAQVNLIHVSATCKNAADEKLRQAIRRFADIHGSPASIILISGDINFAADICDLRHRKKIHVILLHKVNTSEALILCASENYSFTHIVESLPPRTQTKHSNHPVEIVISNLPEVKDQSRVKYRLKQLSDNCGGRVGSIHKNSATIRFSSMENANRAKKRMDGEDVFGNKITAGNPSRVEERKEESPLKSSSVRKIVAKIEEGMKDNKSSSKALDNTKDLKSSNQNGWQSCPNVQWNSEKGSPEDSLTRLRGLPNNSGKPYEGLGPLHPPTAVLPPPPPAIWHSMPPLQWNDSELQSSITLEPSSCAFSFGAAHQTVADKISDSWLPNKLPDGRRKIKGTHKALPAKETAEDRNPLMADSALMNEISDIENRNRLATHVPSTCNVKRSRTPSPLTTNGSIDAQIQQRQSSQYFPSTRSVFKNIPYEMSGRKCQTPSPLMVATSADRNNWPLKQVSPWISGTNNPKIERRSCSPVSSFKSTDMDVSEHYFHPIQSVGSGSNGNAAFSTVNASNPVELQVTNLDQDIDAKDMKRILLSLFREHVMVLHVSVFIQSDGNFAASVKVPSLQDAQYAISQLHRRRIGFKRICISYAHSGGPNPQLIRSQIVSLLLEVPGHRLPLFKFRELFESRYLTSVSVSDLHRMKDVIIVTEEPTGRMVTLNPDHRNTPSPVSSSDGVITDYPYCLIHSKKPKPDKGWAEQEIDALPNLMVRMKLFGQRIHKLIQSHNGLLPLPSLPSCYHAEFKDLEVNEDGVPIEHLLTCVPGVEIHQGSGGVKFLRWKKRNAENIQSSESLKCVSPPLVTQLALFSRELVDLLKTAPHCQLPFNRFIPAYHHHFGRQCRVADYGFTKLIDLLEALPQVVQVMGDGARRMVTLSHRAQIRRFTSDLLRILKSQTNKQVTFSAFATIYEKVIGRPFSAPDYGVCYLEDILAEVSENTVVVSQSPNETPSNLIISVPKREQTPNEIEKTKQFAFEVVELLRHAPQCSLFFNKFIPAYHHHFGHQCRVADYGFTKLIELFEAIPEVAKVEETSEGDRRVTLTLRERLKVLSEQMMSLVQSSGWASNHHHQSNMKGNEDSGKETPPPLLPLSAIPGAFLRQNGYALHYEDFECESLEELMRCISSTVEVIDSPWGPLLSLVDQSAVHRLEFQVRCILLNAPNGRMSLKDFITQFQWKYPGQICSIESLKRDLNSVVKVIKEKDTEVICLSPLEIFGQELLQLLGETPGGKMTFSSLENRYLERFGVAVCPARLGFPSLLTALHSLQKTVVIRGRGQRRSLYVNPELISVGLRLPLEIVAVPVASKASKETNSSNVKEATESVQDYSHEDGNRSKGSTELATLMESENCSDAEVMKLCEIHSEHKVNTSEKSVMANLSPITGHQVLWDCSHVWGFPLPPFQPLFPSQQSPLPTVMVPSTSQGWPEANFQEAFPASALAISCSLMPILPCPIVPPDPSELPFPILGLPRSSSTALLDSESGTVASLPSIEMPEENPMRRRMKMKAHFDSSLLLP